MAAHEHLSGQLRMFIPAKELMTYTAGHIDSWHPDYLPMDKSPNVYEHKLKESKEGYDGSGSYNLYDSIKREGIKHPVSLRIRKKDTQIWDGHHRLVSAHDIDPNMEVPVRYV